MVMAIIYTRCGDYDRAIDQVEELLAQQTSFTVNDFKLSSDLEPLRKLARYQKLMGQYGT